jgi:transcriptional regulator with XRE-family HTH domain
MTVLGDRIVKRIAELGITQNELALRVGMKQPGIHAIISGGVKRPRMLKEIASALETTQEFLLGESDNPCLPDAVTEKIPSAVIEAFERIPGAPLTEQELLLVIGQLDLIARSRTPRNSGN